MAVGAQLPLLELEDELLEDDELVLLLEELELLDDELLELDELPPSRKASRATVGLRVFASQAPLS